MMSSVQQPFCSTPYSSPPHQQYPQAQTTRAGGSAGRSQVEQRIRFAIFIKLLLKRLETSDTILHEQAKSLVSICLAGNRTKGAESVELVECVEIPLRELVGEVHWRRSHAYYTQYELSRSNRKNKLTSMQHDGSQLSL
jgi:hypothetical protein